MWFKDIVIRLQDIEILLQSKSIVVLTQLLGLKFCIVSRPLSDENVEDTPQRPAHLLFRAGPAVPFPLRRRCEGSKPAVVVSIASQSNCHGSLFRQVASAVVSSGK